MLGEFHLILLSFMMVHAMKDPRYVPRLFPRASSSNEVSDWDEDATMHYATEDPEMPNPPAVHCPELLATLAASTEEPKTEEPKTEEPPASTSSEPMVVLRQYPPTNMTWTWVQPGAPTVNGHPPFFVFPWPLHFPGPGHYM